MVSGSFEQCLDGSLWSIFFLLKVCPGPFRSRMMRQTIKAAGESNIAGGTLLGRLGSPSDICGACLFLASPSGAWVTGVSVPVDGGSLLANL